MLEDKAENGDDDDDDDDNNDEEELDQQHSVNYNS
jgi:hypothetical protein